MTSTIATIIGAIVTIIAIAARVFFYLKGKDSEKIKRAEKTLDDIQKGNIAAADDSYDERLRDRYNK